MQLIECTLESLPALKQISARTFIDTYEHLNDPIEFNKYLEKAFKIEQLTAELSNPESFFYFLSEENENVGYLKVNIGAAQTETKESNYLEIERIYILKEMHGKGYGKYLIEKSIQIAMEMKKEKIWLGVFNLNSNAIEFYKYMGFKEVGTHTFIIGNEVQLDIVMEKEVT